MRRTSTPRRPGWGTLAATGYVGAAAVAAVAHGAAGAPDDWGAYLTLATFPGSTVVTVAALCLAGGAGETWDSSDPSDPEFGPFSFLVPYAAGASANVLLLWGALTFGRHFVREARRSRGS
ncbi:hypothetical protein [Streptomyces abyssomicinicus]|uniref:hypothetical protein n=1 Tax=Streptomyces abyssomicinicus TaxID=574929 RepID=UPI00124F782A|nr:hypothetical protein [Streptomyces abyssomicinicus]